MTPAAPRLRVVVLISGSGTNLQALIDAAAAGQPFEICGVISNRPAAPGLARATAAGIPVRVVDHTRFPDRARFDDALGDTIVTFLPGLIVLAGFMRILSAAFIDRFAGRILNIHPSLLPRFQGLHTHRRALEAGDLDHIEAHDFTESGWIRTGLREERLLYRHWFNERNQPGLFYGALALQRALGLSRRPPAGVSRMTVMKLSLSSSSSGS